MPSSECGNGSEGCARGPVQSSGLVPRSTFQFELSSAFRVPRSALAGSVSEMSPPREHHRQPVLVGRGNHLGVTHGSAGLDDGGCPCGGKRVEAVSKREERI